MIPLPDFRKVALTIPLVGALGLQSKLSYVRDKVVRLYKDICLPSDSDLSAKQSLSDFKGAIEKHIEGAIDKELKEIISLVPCEIDSSWATYGATVSYDFFSKATEDPPTVVITFEIGIIFEFHLGFLDDLKKERPLVYKLVRIIICSMRDIFPMTCLETAAAMVIEQFEMDVEQFQGSEEEEGEDVDYSVPINAAKKELEAYRSHFQQGKLRSSKTDLKLIRELHGKLSWEMTAKENSFVETSITLFETWDSIGRKDLEFRADDDYDSERHDVSAFFNLFWNPSGPITEYFYNMFEYDYGNTMAPCVRFVVKNRKSLDKTLSFIKAYFLLMATMAGGNTIWNSEE